jgi:hypothetical protein
MHCLNSSVALPGNETNTGRSCVKSAHASWSCCDAGTFEVGSNPWKIGTIFRPRMPPCALMSFTISSA